MKQKDDRKDLSFLVYSPRLLAISLCCSLLTSNSVLLFFLLLAIRAVRKRYCMMTVYFLLVVIVSKQVLMSTAHATSVVHDQGALNILPGWEQL